MNNLTLFLLGLVLINIPVCLSQNEDKQCFSQSLKPSYPCCEGNKIVFTDKDGDWGVEHNKWCGIGNGNDPSEELNESCFSVVLGYNCCEKCKVVLTDKDGKWGVEHNKWCGIKDSCTSDVEVEPVPNDPKEVEVKDPIQNDPKEVEVKDPVQNDPKEVEVKEPVQNDPNFDFAFLKIENNKKNMLYSPLSIEYALKMLQEGASNHTYAEINKVIGNTELSKYTNIDNILSLANGLFIRDIYYEYVITEYINTLKEKYDAEVIEDPFRSAQNANQWIEDKTLGIIKDILSDDAVSDPDIGMLIINALAIDMEWVIQFDDSKTSGQSFYKDDGEEMIATTLSLNEIKSNNIAYYINDDITVLTLDLKEYEGRQFEFMAIMPKENLSGYVENISKEQINQIDKELILSSTTQDGVNVKIPKFKFNYNLKLKEDLNELGIIDAFDKDKADFSKMVYLYKVDSNIYVGDALHKADIEFTEKGVKAAAVTIFSMFGFGGGFMMEKHPIDVIINKPFMFIIRDKNTKDIWFTGTVYEPNLWENDKEDYGKSFGGFGEFGGFDF